MKEGHKKQDESRDELISMIADVAVMGTENHLEVLGLIKDQNVQIAGIAADVAQVRADVSSVDAKIAGMDAKFAGIDAQFASTDAKIASVDAKVDQVKADVSSIKAKMVASDVAADKRHDELLNAIRSVRGVPGVMFAR